MYLFVKRKFVVNSTSKAGRHSFRSLRACRVAHRQACTNLFPIPIVVLVVWNLTADYPTDSYTYLESYSRDVAKDHRLYL